MRNAMALLSVARILAVAPTSTLPMFTTATESGAILIAITGNAATATTDIVLNFSVWPGDAVRATGQWIITGLWKEPQFDCRQLGVSVFARRRRLDTAIEAGSTTWLYNSVARCPIALRKAQHGQTG